MQALRAGYKLERGVTMAVYLTLTFIGWGMIITAFLLMHHWLMKDTELKLKEQDKHIHTLETKLSLVIEKLKTMN